MHCSSSRAYCSDAEMHCSSSRGYCSPTEMHCSSTEVTVARRKHCSTETCCVAHVNPFSSASVPASLVLKRRRLAIASSPDSLSASSSLIKFLCSCRVSCVYRSISGLRYVSRESLLYFLCFSLAAPSVFIIPLIKDLIHEQVGRKPWAN
jgi:hypothetical protein